MDTVLSKWADRAAEWLADWLNLKDPRLANGQREVQAAMRLLSRTDLEDDQRRELLQKFQGLRVRWMLSDSGVTYLIDEHKHLQLVGHILYDRDPSGPPIVDWLPASSDMNEHGLFLLIRATQARCLHRLAQCGQCRKWFVARRRAQSYCSETCQQQFWTDYRKTPEGRKYQRDRVYDWRTKKRRKK